MNAFLPNRLFIEITRECNLRCKFCKIWKNKNPRDKLTTIEKTKIIYKFVDWIHKKKSSINFKGENFSVVFTGGEPFLNVKEVLSLAKVCQNVGLRSSINTNGTLVYPIIPKILGSGLTHVAFSLDSHIENIHDSLRGVRGTFQIATQGIKKLLNERKIEMEPTVYIQSVLGGWNLENIDALVNWAKELGVDGIEFQPLQYPFGHPSPPHSDWYKSYLFFPTEQQINAGLETLLKMKKYNKDFIFNPISEIKSWYIYFKNPFVLPVGFQPCKALYQNIIVDILGNIKFCFNKLLEPPDRIGNIRRNTFDEIWTGASATAVRKEMFFCQKSCGVMLCHRDANL